MDRLLKAVAIAGLIVGFFSFAALAGVLFEQPARAQDGDTTPAASGVERTITVSGQGRVSARPDIAIVRIGVETEADTATAALDENSVRMSGVISATLDAGVNREDVQTEGLSLRPIYQQGDREPGGEEGPPELVGYRASNVVSVTVRDLDELGALLDAAVEAGGNTIQGIRFEISDNEELRSSAREAAMNDAIAKAEQLTQLAGAELGEVLTIEEVGGEAPSPVRFAETEQAASAAVPVEPGQQEIQVNLRVTWRIR
ncbi:MAG: SIMPL domain-containing protein [Candidatus Promineifilaceae bacterium]|nr:SIMPL domain-containing protein [Candidatus Promineifilaceae bacterium]